MRATVRTCRRTRKRARFTWDRTSTYELQDWRVGVVEDCAPKPLRSRCSFWRITPGLHLSITPFLPMQHDVVTVERFYTDHVSELQLKLLAGASGLKRVIREPT